MLFSAKRFFRRKKKRTMKLFAYHFRCYSAQQALYMKATGQTIQGSILDKISSFLLFSEPLDKK